MFYAASQTDLSARLVIEAASQSALPERNGH